MRAMPRLLASGGTLGSAFHQLDVNNILQARHPTICRDGFFAMVAPGSRCRSFFGRVRRGFRC
jgi:hypothetical protein